jgi:hypothetical protein
MCRVPCEYKHRNLSVRVEEKRRSPGGRGDLAIRFLYQGGQTDIVAVDVAQVRTCRSGVGLLLKQHGAF